VPLIESTHLPRFFHQITLQSTPGFLKTEAAAHSRSVQKVSTEERNTFNSVFKCHDRANEQTWRGNEKAHKVQYHEVSRSLQGQWVSNEDGLTGLCGYQE
jgi:hypothetical protein